MYEKKVLFWIPLRSKGPLFDASITSLSASYFVQPAQPFLECMALGVCLFAKCGDF